MSKASNRVLIIIGFLGVCFLSGCGVTSTSLPSNLNPGGGRFPFDRHDPGSGCYSGSAL